MNKYVVGLIIDNEEKKTLYCKRSIGKSEYKGYWSLPTKSICKDDYFFLTREKSIPPKLLQEILASKLNEDFEIFEVHYCLEGKRHRIDYLLNMVLFRCRTESKAPKYEGSRHYTESGYFEPEEILYKSDKKFGTCVSLYFQYLVNSGVIPVVTDYKEVPPIIADSSRSLEDFSEDELWKLASPNYKLLINGETGTDGLLLRKCTIDIYLENFIMNSIGKDSFVLDLGCGSGQVMNSIRNITKDTFGLDISSQDQVDSRVKSGSIYDVSKIFQNKFDVVILNLVLEWISDLDKALAELSKVLKTDSRVLVSFTNPLISRSSQFVERSDEPYWKILKPIKRERELVMINRCVGPLWYFPRGILDVINSFYSLGFNLIEGKDIYINSFLVPEKVEKVLSESPKLVRHIMIPPFIGLLFLKN